MDSMESELQLLKEERKDDKDNISMQIQEEVAKVKTDFEASTKRSEENAEATPKWSEIVSKAVDSKFTEMQENMAKVNAAVEETKFKFEEQKEKESRQNNIVIYNSEEGLTTRKSGRRKNLTFA